MAEKPHALCDHAVCDHAVCDHAVCDHAVCDHAVCDHAATRPLYSYIYIYAYDSPYNVVVVSCGDVRTESRSAGVDTVQAQGWLVVEREQAFAE